MSNESSVVSCQLSVAGSRSAGVRRGVLARRVHADRAAGGDPDHPARQRGGAAGGLAGAFAPPGERGGPHPSRRAGRARDSALHNGTPSGIRLLPDPAFPLIYLANGQIDPTQPLAANRIIPIEAAPEYSEGMLSCHLRTPPNSRSTFPTRRSTAGESTRLANNCRRTTAQRSDGQGSRWSSTQRNA